MWLQLLLSLVSLLVYLVNKFAGVLLFQEEVGKRRDFRQECVVTIDPDTARVSYSYISCARTCTVFIQDLDDALHVKHLENGTAFLFVHTLV